MQAFASPVEIAPGVHWVGKRDPASIFHANPYVRVFESDRAGQRQWFTLLIDPGSPSDCAVVAARVAEVLGSAASLSAFFLNHQDPDVASSTAFFSQRFAPRAHVLCSEDTWRLVVHFGLDRARFRATDRYLDHGLRLPTGHVLQFVPTPYCHFRGATMLYDRETRVLFSGDLFGGLSPADEQSLWADGSAWPGMRAFHQIYMPSGDALRRAVAAIRALDPAPEIIAPQHGGLLRGEWIELYLRRLEQLPVGVELLDDDDRDALAWSSVLRKITAVAEARGRAASSAGRLATGTRDRLEDRLVGLGDAPSETAPAGGLSGLVEACLSADDLIADTTRREGDRRVVVRHGRWTIERALALLAGVLDHATMNEVVLEALAAADVLQLPTPRVDLDATTLAAGVAPTADAASL